jgi:tetratricopeptide (TPR) repeat protein
MDETPNVTEEKKPSSFNDSISNIVNTLAKHPYRLILGFAIIVYFQTIFFEYVLYDDQNFLFNSPQNIEKLTSLKTALTTPYMYSTYYRPIINLSFYFDSMIARDAAWMHHLTNLIIHCINCCLIFILFYKLKYSRNTSLIVALIYSVHPLLINSVVWIVGRNDMIVSLFSILSFIFLIDFIKNEKWSSLILHGISIFLASFSKEAALMLPFLFFVYWFYNRNSKIIQTKQALLFLIWFTQMITLPFVKFSFEMAMIDPYFKFGHFIKNLPSIPESLTKFFFPFSITTMPTINPVTTIIGLIILLAGIIYIYMKRKTLNMKQILFASAWFLVLYFPGLFIRIQKADFIFHYLDCRVYLPLIGVFIILIEILKKTKFKINLSSKFFIVLVLMMVLSVLNLLQSPNYKDRRAFRERAAIGNLKIHPEFMNLNPVEIDELFDSGIKKKDSGNFVGAINNFSKIIQLDSNNYRYYVHRGLCFIELKNYQKALNDFSRVLELKPKYLPAFYQRGLIKIELKDFVSAISDFDKALELNPDYNAAYYHRGGAKLEIMDYKGAVEDFSELIKREPESIYAYSRRGIAKNYLEDYKGAINDFNQMIKIKPDFPNSYFQRGLVKMKLNQKAQACSDFQKASDLGSQQAQQLLQGYCKQTK